jgi:hypothetical protein
MASESCPICGEEADADEIDAHGHFSGDDEDDEDEEIVHLLILGLRKDRTACGLDPDDISSGASTNEGDVNCAGCRAAM